MANCHVLADCNLVTLKLLKVLRMQKENLREIGPSLSIWHFLAKADNLFLQPGVKVCVDNFHFRMQMRSNDVKKKCSSA